MSYLNPFSGFQTDAKYVSAFAGAEFVEAVSNAVDLTGSNCTQSNSCSIGEITQNQALSAANCTQTNSSSSNAITQTHVLSASNCSQTNDSSIGAITIDGALAITLSATNCSQTNSSSSNAITQTHVLSASNCSQTNTSLLFGETAGSTLNAENCEQQNECDSQAITIQSFNRLSNENRIYLNAFGENVLLTTKENNFILKAIVEPDSTAENLQQIQINHQSLLLYIAETDLHNKNVTRRNFVNVRSSNYTIQEIGNDMNGMAVIRVSRT